MGIIDFKKHFTKIYRLNNKENKETIKIGNIKGDCFTNRSILKSSTLDDRPHTTSNTCLTQERLESKRFVLSDVYKTSTVFAHDSLVSCIQNTKQVAVLSENFQCRALVLNYKFI